jgi:hypothetical protein
MFSTARVAPVLLLGVVLVPSPGSSAAGATTIVSLEPVISFVGGSQAQRTTVLNAVDRFTSHDLALPDLEVRFHAGAQGCEGYRGLFHPDRGHPSIDLCYEGEFLVLHELGHAWEHFNLDDQTRQTFVEYVGAGSWTSAKVRHKAQAVEIAADTMAYGLLSAPLAPGQNLDREFARFELLTGSPSPRLPTSADPPDVSPAQVA